jgi:hypothetical protein
VCCLPLTHGACRVTALANQLRRLASYKAGQATYLFMRGAQAHICIAAEYWPKFFHHFMALSFVCFMRFRGMFHIDVACNTPGVCHSLSSGFELKHDRLSGDDKVKVNLWRGA